MAESGDAGVASADGRAESQARLRVALPGQLGPEQWVAQTGDQRAPATLLAAEAQRRPEGYGFEGYAG